VIGATEIYTMMVNAGVPVDHHESDLYAKKTQESERIIEWYEHSPAVSIFLSSADNSPWYDIPFAYMPWWEARSMK
jgi:hypothetical protein